MQAVGLPTDPPGHPKEKWDVQRLLSLIGADKKVAQGQPVFVLANGIGDAFIAHDVDLSDVEAVLRQAIAA